MKFYFKNNYLYSVVAEHRVDPNNKNGVNVSLELQWDGYVPGWEDDGYPHEDSRDLKWDGYFPGKIQNGGGFKCTNTVMNMKYMSLNC